MTRLVLRALTKLLGPPRVIHSRDGSKPYLSRWYLPGLKPRMPDGSEPFDEHGNARKGIVWGDRGWDVFVHRFHMSDDDGAPHNHPWEWAVSIVLAGGYDEQRSYFGGYSQVRRVKPFSVNRISHADFHRVDLLEHDAWSIFIVGPKTRSWGFLEFPRGGLGVVTPWREFLARHQTKRPEDRPS